MLKLKGPNMASGKHAPNFPLKHAQKDVKFALQEAKAVKARVPVAAAAHTLYERALEDGRGDEDFSAVIDALRCIQWQHVSSTYQFQLQFGPRGARM